MVPEGGSSEGFKWGTSSKVQFSSAMDQILTAAGTQSKVCKFHLVSGNLNSLEGQTHHCLGFNINLDLRGHPSYVKIALLTVGRQMFGKGGSVFCKVDAFITNPYVDSAAHVGPMYALYTESAGKHLFDGSKRWTSQPKTHSCLGTECLIQPGTVEWLGKTLRYSVDVSIHNYWGISFDIYCTSKDSAQILFGE